MISGSVDQVSAGLSLKTSQWVITSDAYIADDRGDLAVVIHSVATNVHPPLTSSDVRQLAFPLIRISGSPAAGGVSEAAMPEDSAFLESLTAREIEVLQLVAEGLPNERIAQRLAISPSTVMEFMARIRRKRGESTHAQAQSRATAEIQELIEDRLGLQADFRRVSLDDARVDADEDDSVTPELVDMMASWLELLGVPGDLALAETLLRTPVPVLGSPPEEWKGIAELIGNLAPSPFLAAAGWSAWGDRPVLAVIAGSTGLVVWFGKPLGDTVIDHLVKTLKSRLENDPQIHDSEDEEPAED